jgi:hypothetical protein
VNWIAIGGAVWPVTGLVCAPMQARLSAVMAQTGNRVRNRLSAMEDATRMKGTTEKPQDSCRAGYVRLMSIPAVSETMPDQT